MSRLQRFFDGFDAIYNAIYFRFDLQDNIDRCAFFYELNFGWYDMYDPDDFDAIIKALEDPPKYIKGLANLMKRKLPYD